MLMVIGLVGCGVLVCLSLVLPGAAWALGRVRRAIWILESRRQLRKHRTIIAEYEPPADLKPAQLAYLYDQTFGEEELLATVFDLERRGFLKLHKTERSNDFVVTVQRVASPDLENYEQELLLALKHWPGVARWQRIRSDIVKWESSYERQLEESLQQKGLLLLEDSDIFGNRLKWLMAGIISFATVALPSYMLEIHYPRTESISMAQLDRMVMLIPIGLTWAVTFVIVRIAIEYTQHAYNRALNMERASGLLKHLWPAIDGYREFVQRVELHRIHYANQHEHSAVQHSVLADAIALDLTTRWQQRFKG